MAVDVCTLEGISENLNINSQGCIGLLTSTPLVHQVVHHSTNGDSNDDGDGNAMAIDIPWTSLEIVYTHFVPPCLSFCVKECRL